MPQKNTRRSWSVAALLVAICAVVCCFLPPLGMSLGGIAVLFCIISRISLGYFDNISTASLIIAVFGIVFGAGAIIALSNPAIKEAVQNMFKK